MAADPERGRAQRFRSVTRLDLPTTRTARPTRGRRLVFDRVQPPDEERKIMSLWTDGDVSGNDA
jgi:hypothetical protein